MCLLTSKENKGKLTLLTGNRVSFHLLQAWQAKYCQNHLYFPDVFTFTRSRRTVLLGHERT